MSAEPLLEVAGLWAHYGGTPILQGVQMAAGRGEIVGIIGRNGVGKTTAMRCLIGLLRASQGTIRLRGEDLTALPAEERARRGIGYIPQGREVFPRLTVEENLAVGLLVGGPGGRKLTDLVYTYFPRLAERRGQLAGTMSGGEQQQLAIGRAVVGNPTLLLLDEPSEGVQPSIVQMICRTLRQLRDELGLTIVFVEQNLDTILSIAERCYVMEKGRVTASLNAGNLDAVSVRAHLML